MSDYPPTKPPAAPPFDPTSYQREAMTPAITSTVLITLFFGLFGLIPAVGNTNRARALGVQTSKYWTAFWVTLAANVVVWGIFIAMIVNAGNDAVKNYDHVNACINGSSIGPNGELVWPPGCGDVAGP